MEGMIAIWKPAGITSFDVIREFKHEVLKQLPQRVKLGHAGTLDPFAEGVLILLLGKSTRLFDEIQKWPKTYRAVATLGGKSDTLDYTGKITKQDEEVGEISKEELEKTLKAFIGEIEQIVPQFSAAKFKGKPLYKYARRGEVVPEKKKIITIYDIKVMNFSLKEVELLIKCSSGTYVRQLSFDIFRSLGIESYLAKLTREAVGNITKNECLTIDQLTDVDTVVQRVRPVLGELGT